MWNRNSRVRWLALVLAAAWGLSCTNAPPQVSQSLGSVGGSTAAAGSPPTAGSGVAAGTGGSSTEPVGPPPVVMVNDGGMQDTCEPLSCTPPGGQYCGAVGNGCTGTMVCPACPNDWVCDHGLCKGGPTCMPRTSCSAGEASYCGVIGDDCGSALDCGDCTAPATCGGRGTPNICGDPACVPMKCELPVGQYCGTVGDGCGGALDCGACPNGEACGGDGIQGVCPGSSLGVACTGIQCDVESCASPDIKTTVTGVVYDPAGVNPLYNVWVYVPNAPLEEIPTGATCERCLANLSGSPIATALTDASGHFKLEGVPTGENIPIVMQVGRWRRQVTLPKVQGCADNPVDDPQLLRLPRNQQEGHIPLIAITTGRSDALECLIPRVGLDRAEVTTDTGTGRVHLYAGAGTASTGMGMFMSGPGATSMTPGGDLTPATTLWADAMKMRGYDIVMYSCEGDEQGETKDAYLGNFEDYVNNGGRAFLTHYHYYWLNHGSTAFQGTADFAPEGMNPPDPSIGVINTTFPKGAALADWLVNVGASSTRGQLSIAQPRASMRTAVAPSQDWISVATNPSDMDKPALQYMTFNTPLGVAAEDQCGRVVDTDLHVGAPVTENGVMQGGDTSTPATPYPGGCRDTPMSPQIKALEFIFFDLSSCVTPEMAEPEPPPPPPLVGAPPPPVPVPPPPPPPPPR